MLDNLKSESLTLLKERCKKVYETIKNTFTTALFGEKKSSKPDTRRWYLDMEDSEELAESDEPLYRLVALKEFSPIGLKYPINPGDLGGYVTKEVADLMSQHGSCWVEEGCYVCGNVSIRDNVSIINNSHIVALKQRPICEKASIHLTENVLIDGCTLFANVNDRSIIIGGFVEATSSKITGNVKLNGHIKIEHSVIRSDEDKGAGVVVDLYKDSIIYNSLIEGNVKIITSDVFMVNSKIIDKFQISVPGIISEQYLCGNQQLTSDIFSLSFRLDHSFFKPKFGDVTHATACFMVNLFTLEFGVHIFAFDDEYIEDYFHKHFKTVEDAEKFFNTCKYGPLYPILDEFKMYKDLFFKLCGNLEMKRQKLAESNFTGNKLADAVLTDEDRERFQSFIDDFEGDTMAEIDLDEDDNTNFFEEKEEIVYVPADRVEE